MRTAAAKPRVSSDWCRRCAAPDTVCRAPRRADRGRLHRRRRRRSAGSARARRAGTQRDHARRSGVRPTARPSRRWSRLWTLQAPVARSAVEQALPGAGRSAGARPVCSSSRAARCARCVDVRPYADDESSLVGRVRPDPRLDGRERRMQVDHVLGVSSASTSLAQLTIREPVGRALDLGTGSGVQALHLSRHSPGRGRHRRERALPRTGAARPRASTTSRRPAGRRPLRAGGGRDLRPVVQPALRDLAGNRRSADLPRLRACPVTRSCAGCWWRGASTPHGRRLVPGAGQLGTPDGPVRGRSGRRLVARDRLRRLGRAAGA